MKWQVILVLVAMWCLPLPALAEDDAGLAVGDSAPDFTLKDQNDQDVSLSGLLEEANVAIVFYRSADW